MISRIKRLVALFAVVAIAATGCAGDADYEDRDASTRPDTQLDAGPDGADGGEPVEEEIVVCERTLTPAPTGAACSAASGASDLVLLEGEVLGGDKTYQNGQVLIDRSGPNATIACVGCDCDGLPGASDATVVTCASSVISPGLINAHEHLGWATGSPKPHGDERYDHRHDWRIGARGHTEISSGRGDYSDEAVLFGELRHLMGGATSIAGSGGAAGLLRNLDRTSATEGLDVSVEYDTFPLGDTNGALMADGCDYRGFPGQDDLSGDIYLPHIAEGIDPEAQNEYACLSGADGAGQRVIAGNVSMIHGVGLSAADIADFAAEGAHLVWSPRTNVDLYGNTADVITYDKYGVTIGLGTDWVLSGSMNMLRELSCADYLNQNHYGGYFSDKQLWKMATANGAEALGVGDRLGTLTEGYVADIAVFDATSRSSHRAVLEAGSTDVQLVLRGGRPLLGEPGVVEALVAPADVGRCEPLDVCGKSRRVCAELDTGFSWSTIVAAANGSYAPFFCEAPTHEPSCIPARPGEYTGMSMADDQDGDGVVDAQDTCPTIFNPSRPLDEGTQADFDTDGIGDACDSCPFDAGETCDPFDPEDRDDDGVPNRDDNCPATANADQADSEQDGIGDACDGCPQFSNPGQTGCPATTYDVWSGTSVKGDKVLLRDVVVTAVNGEDAIFVQHPSDSTDFAGVERSGIFVYMPDTSPRPARGDRLDVSATIGEYGGSLQLANVDAVTIHSSGNALPEPVRVEPARVATGGADVDKYLGVLVRVDDVQVTDANPDAPDDYGEFAVTAGLRVDDLLYELTPAPQVGDTFDALIGPLVYSFGNSKLVPRDANDFIGSTEAAPPCLIIGEYVEGSSNNKGIELFNCGSNALELSSFGICQANNTGSECDAELMLPPGTLAAGGVHTLCHPSAIVSCDTTHGTVLNHNGNDRFVVYRDDDGSEMFEAGNDLVTDAFGETSVDPGQVWSDTTYRRCNFSPYDGQGAFSVLDYFTEHATDDFSDFGNAPTAGCP